MEFIYRLTLIDRLFTSENWTEEDQNIIREHFSHLQSLLLQNKLIIAGKTAGLDPDTIGLVIFQAESLEEANFIMNSDPAIKKGIMTGQVQEYTTALFNKSYKKE